MRPRRLLSYLLHLGLLALTSATLLSCGEIDTNPSPTPASSSETEVEKNDGDCEPGVLGCRCLRGDFECWDEEAICIGGICREQTCEVGEENCACFANSTCSQAADGSWLVCGVNGICRTPACPQGAEGCGCFAGYQCNEGLFCQDDGQNPPSCVRPNCPAGDLNCGCFPDRSCGVDATGAQLVCEGNTCTRPQCQQGSDGCACNADFSCDGNLLCSNGVCGAPTCVQGSLSCACAPDGSCNEGLSCDANGTCQAVNCPQGEEGCGCFSDFTCGVDGDSQLLCSAAGRCVRSDCRAGLANCGCDAAGNCVDGYLCRNGFCVERPATDPNIRPAEPSDYDICLTSCKGDYTDPVTGQFAPCSSDGLMEACLSKGDEERTCVLGSCIVETQEEPRRCLDEEGLPDQSLCPAHQRCDVDGICASNCRSDNDCYAGRQCHMYVCRAPCDVNSSSCGEDEYCATRDAESGFCMPKVPVETDELNTGVRDRFSVNVNLLHFTNTQTQLKVIITNHSDRRITIPVFKWKALLTNDNGTDLTTEYDETSDTLPLHWVNLAARNKSNAPALDISETPYQLDIPHAEEDLLDNRDDLKPNQVELIVTLDTTVPEGAERSPIPKVWSGELKLGDRHLGEALVGLSYFEQPDGRWQGTITYFSDFQVDEVKLDNWINALRSGNRTSPTDGNYSTQNVLLSAWYAFTSTGLPIENKWNAAFSSLKEDTWIDSSDVNCSKPYCFKAVGFSCPNQYCDFNIDQAFPPPSGAMEYPFAVNLKTDGLVLEGKIVSDIALQYASGPKFSLKLTDDLKSCAGRPRCMIPVQSQDGLDVLSESIFGGRYLASINAQGEASCDTNSAAYELVGLPWFIEGLKSTSVYDEATDQYMRYQCRLHNAPLAEASALNKEFAAYNPVLDGQARSRKLEIIDGGLLNGDRLIIIFRESFENFIPGAEDQLYAYGVIDLTKEVFDLTEDAYDGNENVAPPATVQEFTATCSADLLNELGKLERPVDPSDDPYTLENFGDYLDRGPETLSNVILTLINGVGEVGKTEAFASSRSDATESQKDNLEAIHYLCHDTGRIDGIGDEGGCPIESKVTYFVLGKRPDVQEENSAIVGVTLREPVNDQELWTLVLPEGQLVPAWMTEGSFIFITQTENNIERGRLVFKIQSLPEEGDPLEITLEQQYTDSYVIPWYPLEDEWIPDLGIERWGRLLLPSSLEIDVGYEFAGTEIEALPCQNIEGVRGTCDEFLGAGDVINNNQLLSAGHAGSYWLSAHSDSDTLSTVQYFCHENYDNNTQQVICDDNRFDLREGLDFYRNLPDDQKPNLSDIYSDIIEAFRYRSRFQNRSGVGLGFTPAICDPATDNLRYCYSPAQIEKIRERVDCLQWVYNEHRAMITNLEQTALSTARSKLERFMRANFGVTYIRSTNNTTPIRKDGFEKLYAELLIMLGQESYTNALRARFDLAGIRGAAFPGALFEVDGVSLSGTAGFEMYNLYKAIQYFDFALEQFYSQLQTINKMSEDDASRVPAQRIITGETVEEYYNKLIIASTEKARAWSEIARKYQAFNRADLARVVLKRGYASVYVESVIFSHLISTLNETLPPRERAQTEFTITQMQRKYEMALRDMREIYANLSDEPKVFGELLPSYIPFPALDVQESNAFEKIMISVRRKLSDAAAKEERALNESRSFETDTALFQQELTRLRNSYESQLGDLCGTFEADNGRIYPSVSRYAHLGVERGIQNVDDPCGLVGNGTLHQRYVDMEILLKDFALLQQQHEGELEKLKNVQKLADASCNQIQDDAEIMFEYGSQISSLRDEIRKSERSISDAQNEFSKAQQDANRVSACSPSVSRSASVGVQGGVPTASASVSSSYNPGACTAATKSVKAHNTLETKSNNAKDKIDDTTAEIESLDNERARVAAESECARLQINADYDILNGLINLRSHDLKVVKLIYRKRALESEIESLQHQAKRLITEQADAEQMTIDVEAARNDPNVRIYRNDAVQAAQRTFESARLEVYKATKVFEYYSSQSYPPLNDLFLVRMISRGNPTLEAYVDELEDAFNGFEEDFGIPDLRVDVISVRDDLLRIPLTEDNVDLSQKERVSQFREAISDNGLLDRNGYRVIPFALGGRRLSPLTRNHKISHIEAEFVGARVGDSVGRLYLRNSGTSIVKPLRGFTQYYSFPKHIAVINTFFNGQKVFPPELYQNRRLRDRPYLNSRWELIFNNVDEEANQDIDLNSLTDIKLYVYYRDFTDY